MDEVVRKVNRIRKTSAMNEARIKRSKENALKY